MRVRVGHSPDPDDAFMFWAIADGRVDTGGLEIEGVAADIETLNEWAREGRLEATALSAGAYPYVAERYALLPHGASLGDGYGPVVVARDATSAAALAGRRVAVPGALTTAFLVARLALPPFVAVHVAFDEIISRVLDGSVDAGVVIHEGQLTYRQQGLVLVVDLGAWWLSETTLPLPLGATAVRRDLPGDVQRTLSRVMREAIDVGLAHREQALAYAIEYGRGISRQANDQFVGMYVNAMTRDYGPRGRAAVDELLRRGAAIGAFGVVSADFAE
jgi:1,4-dihydroxy-6-naphthoate synthase